jgi:hypothetical protein
LIPRPCCLLAASATASSTAVAASAEADTGTDSNATGLSSPSGGVGAGAKAKTAAALVELSGASSMTVGDYLVSVPPDMAAATTLMNELSASGAISYAAASSVYTLLDSSATLALTSD